MTPPLVVVSGPPATDPPDLGVPCLRVDTSRPWDAAAITAWVRARLG